MTHLTATIADTARLSIRAIDRVVQRRLATQPANSVFYGPGANFLELPRVAFHYSVISVDAMNTLAPGLGDRHIPYNGSAAPNTRGDVAGVRARAGYEIKAQPSSNRSRLGTGGRKSNANGCGFAARTQVDITDVHTGMIQSGKNIPATSPPYATVAPILHRQVRANLIGRGATSNTGAADAYGR